MATPIRVGVLEAAEARDLVEALAVRGLIGTMSESRRGCWVELNEPHEETERLIAEVTAALEAWLLDRGRGPLNVRVGERHITVEASAILDDVLRSRLPGRPRRDSPQR